MKIKKIIQLLAIALSLLFSSCASHKGELKDSNVYKVVKIPKTPESGLWRVGLKQEKVRFTLLCDTSNYFSCGNKIRLGHKYKLNLYCVYPCATINGVEIHPFGPFEKFLFRAKNMDGLFVYDDQCNCMSYYHIAVDLLPEIDTLIVKNLLNSIDEGCFSKNPSLEDPVKQLIRQLNESYPQELQEIIQEIPAPQQQIIQKYLH